MVAICDDDDDDDDDDDHNNNNNNNDNNNNNNNNNNNKIERTNKMKIISLSWKKHFKPSRIAFDSDRFIFTFP